MALSCFFRFDIGIEPNRELHWKVQVCTEAVHGCFEWLRALGASS